MRIAGVAIFLGIAVLGAINVIFYGDFEQKIVSFVLIVLGVAGAISFLVSSTRSSRKGK
jgi:phage-related holin